MLYPSSFRSSAFPRVGARRVLRMAAFVELLQVEALQTHIEQLTGEIDSDLSQGLRQMEAATRRERRALAQAVRKTNLGLPPAEAWPSIRCPGDPRRSGEAARVLGPGVRVASRDKVAGARQDRSRHPVVATHQERRTSQGLAASIRWGRPGARWHGRSRRLPASGSVLGCIALRRAHDARGTDPDAFASRSRAAGTVSTRYARSAGVDSHLGGVGSPARGESRAPSRDRVSRGPSSRGDRPHVRCRARPGTACLSRPSRPLRHTAHAVWPARPRIPHGRRGRPHLLHAPCGREPGATRGRTFSAGHSRGGARPH